MKQYYLIDEAAAILGVTRRSVFRYIRKGTLKAETVRSGKPQRVRTRIDRLSLEKCFLRNNSYIYGCRDRVVNALLREKVDRAKAREALREVGIVNTDLDDLSYFSVDEDALNEIIERGTEYWTKYDVAAYMGCSLSTVKRLIRRGKLKAVKRDPDGKNLFSNLDVMEVYAQRQGALNEGQGDEDDYEDNASLNALFVFLENNQMCIPLLSEVLSSFN